MGVDVGPGHYRLRKRDDDALFGHSAGPQSWKQFLHPPRQKLWSSDGQEPEQTPRYAFLGVRACDLAAIAMLNGVLGKGAHPDQGFMGRLGRIFVVAVNCTEPDGLCFCASMGTGPRWGRGTTWHSPSALTTTADAMWSTAGLSHREASQVEIDSARSEVAEAAHHMGRQMPTGDLRELLIESRESPHWDEVASRCLTCGNCTMACPTCFCTSVEDVTDLTGEHAERWMNWTSCFEFDFTFVHEGSVRQSGPSRYRHWITHKLGTWHDQFGSSGCVGCGRCIAWCPTGIDITEEMNTLAQAQDGDD